MNTLSVLVVDDEQVMRKLLQRHLLDWGCRVVTAESGEEALELLGQNYFDVVITDLRMPGLDGLGLLAEVKTHYSRTEVIVITAYAEIKDAVKALRQGATDYLSKPLNFEELALQLERIKEVRALYRTFGDLRNALEVTENSAAETISSLESALAESRSLSEKVRHVLTHDALAPKERIAEALELLRRK
jgi:two-component system, OmpR family, response regulator